MKRKSWRAVLTVLLAGGLAVAASVTYWTVPRGNMGGGPVDVLLVLGSPAEIDGSVTQLQRWRVDEAIREFRAGQAPHVLFTGGAAGNRFVEAEIMSRYARSQGLPDRAIWKEGNSTTTLENLRNSRRLMQEQGWRSVEVISSPDHLPRAAALLLCVDPRQELRWRVHAASTPGRSRLDRTVAYAEGGIGTVAIRWFGPSSEPVLHLLALTQHRIAFGVRWVYYRLREQISRHAG